LIRFCQGAGATLIPSSLWGMALPEPRVFPEQKSSDNATFYLRPRYRNDRPLDATLLKVDAALDRFPEEACADQIAAILEGWSRGLLQSSVDTAAIENALGPGFSAESPKPGKMRDVRSDSILHIVENQYAEDGGLGRDAFLKEWRSELALFSNIEVAEFQITSIHLEGAGDPPPRAATRIRYEIVGSGNGFHREQRLGTWDLVWVRRGQAYQLRHWRTLGETRARSHSPVYIDATAAVLGSNPSYANQMLHGTDYWRTVLDGACGIDIYGHNGVSAVDIDNDGFDDLYVCQPAGLPNRLYRNRSDGTFEDITQRSGLGILENTACALFADFNNDGLQHVVLVRTSGPVLFINEGDGKFREKPDAFHFAKPPQGTFTGAAVADYDRDGWLDIYFCLYAYYQGTGQYRYPSPYHDAENGPPNFLMRNNRDGTFRDVTEASGLNKNNTRYSFCCAWNDFNRDGWPDLYVVNDFGRKNLYRNNGDGTFIDVAAESGTEDVGAGMSVSWLDYDNDGAPDVYVANMWASAGMRVSTLDEFKKESAADVRALYQKHAMGNSLLANRGKDFKDETHVSGVGVGRWSWSSDSFDFDHDGYPDLYIANGMVSGPSLMDLNSFFWRQVVANSADQADASGEYEQGWNAINELIRSDGTWSGYERNVFYANNRDGTFSDVSAALGLDFIEDGRSFALADFDHDGRMEIVLKNRNGPQLRLLQNVVEHLPSSIAFRLEGTKSNRDAVGAVITIETESVRRTRSLQAGSGFLAQHSKEVFFGLGNSKGPVRASIHWPSGLVQELKNLPPDHRIWVKEGSDLSRIEPFKVRAVRPPATQAITNRVESLPATIETWLIVPVPAPDFSLPDQSGQTRSLAALKGTPVLLYLWTSRSQQCLADLRTFEQRRSLWKAQGLTLLAMNVDEGDSGAQRFAFPVIRVSNDISAIYNLLYRQLFDRHRDISLPIGFLIDAEGSIVKVYQGSIVAEQVEKDFRSIPGTDSQRLKMGLPFPNPGRSFDFGRNYLSSGSLFFQRGYFDQAEVFFQRALRDDPSSAEALYGIGSVYLNQNKNAAAREMFERCVKLQPGYPDTLPDAWNNLGVLATRENQIANSIDYFQQALKLNPRHLLSLDNLGNAYRTQKRWDEARKVLERALEIAPDDPEANYSLGMVFAQEKDTDKAYEHLQRALKERPVYPEALNNLGILYLLTQRRDQAVASFEECIRVAPTFDQAYLNLARVYALEGSREKARTLLLDLMKQHPDHPQARQMLEQLQN
jgi:tetratricopeptide (TPR) repeat protein